MNIEFKIKNNILTRKDANIIIIGNYNVYKCIFTFEGETWKNIQKYAVFYDEDGVSLDVPLGFDEGQLTCIIPPPLLDGNYFKVAVKGDGVLPTNRITVGLTPFSEDVDHHVKCKRNKGAFAEIFDRLDDKLVNLDYSDQYIHIYSNRGLVDSIYIPSGGGGEDCCDKLRRAIEQIKLELNEKADIEHTHSSGDISDLESAIDSDMDTFADDLINELNK